MVLMTSCRLLLAVFWIGQVTVGVERDQHGGINAKHRWMLQQNISTIYLVSSCHLDVGFADSAANIVNRYFDFFFPEAILIANTLREYGGEERLVFTTHSYLVSRSQTLFFAQGRYRFQYKRGAYTESDNAPARKTGSGYARLTLTLSHFIWIARPTWGYTAHQKRQWIDSKML